MKVLVVLVDHSISSLVVVVVDGVICLLYRNLSVVQILDRRSNFIYYDKYLSLACSVFSGCLLNFLG